MDIHEINKSAYAAAAEGYRHRTDSKGIAGMFDIVREVVPAGRILDLGCGTGKDIIHMLDAGYAPIGLDISPEMIELARIRVRNHLVGRDNLDELVAGMFHVMPMEDVPLGQYPFEEAGYACVWAVTSIQHIPRASLPAVLEKAHKLLAPTGVLAVKTRAPRDGQTEYECLETSAENGVEFQRFFAYYPPDEFIDSLRQARFEVTHTSTEANGQIQYASINNGQPGYKFWVVARKQQ